MLFNFGAGFLGIHICLFSVGKIAVLQHAEKIQVCEMQEMPNQAYK